MVEVGVMGVGGGGDRDGEDDDYIEAQGGIRYSPKNKLWLIRGLVVMFDNEVARAYDKEVDDLKQILDQDAKSHPVIFDKDHCFQLSSGEYREIRGDRYFTGLLRKR